MIDKRPLHFRLAFTLVEMLTTVAVLVIVLGLMVSLARHVRDRAAQALTKDLLRQLDVAMDEYLRRHGNAVPEVSPFPPPAVVAAAGGALAREVPLDPPRADRRLLNEGADANNRDLVQAFKSEGSLSDGLLKSLPASVYDGVYLRDAWGSPIVFMPTKHPWVGTAPLDKKHFFFSAGPDKDYLTRDDNLYSYEETGQHEQFPVSPSAGSSGKER